MRIACVGGGPAGLYVSILIKLRNRGHDVCVYERKQSGLISGWGVTFGTELLETLYENDSESARVIHDSSLCWREQVLRIRGASEIEHGEKVYNISRTLLLDILATRARDLGVRIEYNCEVFSPADLTDADLIIAADGLNSRMRQAGSFRASEVSARNKHIWLGVDKPFRDFNYIFEPSGRGWLWAYAYAMNDTESTFIVECAPETWTAFGFDAMSTASALPILERVFSHHLDGHRLIGTHGDGSMARWYSFKTIRNPYWHAGKIVLVGDSAHTTNFTIGMGTTVAIDDAVALARSLFAHSDLEAALTDYERGRQEEIARVAGEAECSARWFENSMRYLNLQPHQMAELLWARRSKKLAQLPPKLAYLMHHMEPHFGLRNFIRPGLIWSPKRHTRQRGRDEGSRILTRVGVQGDKTSARAGRAPRDRDGGL